MVHPLLYRDRAATISLMLSVVFAVGVAVYFVGRGQILYGIALGILVVVAGIWEFKRKLADVIAEERNEAKAKRYREKRQN